MKCVSSREAQTVGAFGGSGVDLDSLNGLPSAQIYFGGVSGPPSPKHYGPGLPQGGLCAFMVIYLIYVVVL